jgi:hypothetical protein
MELRLLTQSRIARPSPDGYCETEPFVQADRLFGGRDAVLVVDDTAIAKKGAPTKRGKGMGDCARHRLPLSVSTHAAISKLIDSLPHQVLR